MGLIGSVLVDCDWDVMDWIGSKLDTGHGEGEKMERRLGAILQLREYVNLM